MKEIVSTIMTAVSLGLGVQGSLSEKAEQLIVESPAFDNEKDIPQKYTCEGENIQPPLVVQNLPKETKTVTIVMYDEDGPGGHYVHWVAFNIKPQRVIEENSQPGTNGKNSKGTNIYFGPCPLMGTHDYHFQVYALDIELKLSLNADERVVKKAMNKHIIGYGELTGRYKKAGMADY